MKKSRTPPKTALYVHLDIHVKSPHPAVDVVELHVPIRMLFPLQRLTVRLQTVVTQRVQ